MSYLLDTHVILWLSRDPEKVPVAIRTMLRTSDADVWVSVVSAWEYGQKRKVRPSEMLESFETITATMPVLRLNLDFGVHSYAESLPLIHRDPFDRMLIAQAIYHDLTLVTSNTQIHQYPVKTLW